VAWQRPLLSPSPPASAAPFQAVPDTPYFVGREAVLAQLETYLLPTVTTAICTLQGMAGLGKTAVATRIAYQLRPHFPDGVLWARLDTSDTMTILRTFAQAYGMDVSQYADVDSRSRVVRGLLADKRALIILDNATDSAGVEPLLPPTGQCAILITTRRHDLRVAQGANRIVLHPFTPDDETSQQLFTHFLGADRVMADAESLAEIADYVGYLPLALAIIAGRLAYEPDWTTVDFLQRIKQDARRLKELQSEDQNIRLSFAASYALLPAEIQTFFATLSLLGGDDFNPAVAAVAADVDSEDGQDYLRVLYRLSLVQSSHTGRYRLHPLLRDYAREQVIDYSARSRLVDYFVAFIEQNTLDTTALATESDAMLALVADMQANGETAVVVSLIIALTPFLKMQGLYDLAQEPLIDALQSAQRNQRLPILLHLIQIARYHRRYAEVDAYLAQATAIVKQTDVVQQKDVRYLTAIETEKGILAACRGNYGEARTHFYAGLALPKRESDPTTHISLLKEVGASELVHGNYEQAESHYQHALRIAQEQSPTALPMLLRCLGGIAIIHHQDFARAKALYEKGLRQARSMNNRVDMVLLLNNLAVVALEEADAVKAKALLIEGLALARLLFYQAGVGVILSNLGRLAIHEQQWDEAQHYLEEGLALATAVSHHELIVASHYSLGLLCGKQQNYPQAETHFQIAIQYAQKINHLSSVVSILKGWGWLFSEQKKKNVASRFSETFLELSDVCNLTQSPDEFATLHAVFPLERLKIFYD